MLQDETRSLTIAYSKCLFSSALCGFLLVCFFPDWKTKGSIPKLVSSYRQKKFNPGVLIITHYHLIKSMKDLNCYVQERGEILTY